MLASALVVCQDVFPVPSLGLAQGTHAAQQQTHGCEEPSAMLLNCLSFALISW